MSINSDIDEVIGWLQDFRFGGDEDDHNISSPSTSGTTESGLIEDSVFHSRLGDLHPSLTGARDLYISGNYYATKTVLSQIIDSQFTEIHRFQFCSLKGLSFFNLSEYSDSIKNFEECSRLRPNDSGSLNNIGLCFFYIEDYEQALLYFNRSLSIKQDSTTFNNKGRAHESINELNEALLAYQESNRLKPNNINILVSIASVQRLLGHFQESLSVCNHSLSINQDSISVLHLKALILHSMRDYNASLQCYNQILARFPNNTTALNNAAVVLIRIKKYQEALDNCNKALEKKPNQFDSLCNKALALHYLGRWNEAIDWYLNALQYSTIPDPVTYNNLAVSLQKVNKPTEALSYYDKSLEIRPNHTHTMTNRAYSLVALGQYIEAIDQYNQCLNILNVSDSKTINDISIENIELILNIRKSTSIDEKLLWKMSEVDSNERDLEDESHDDNYDDGATSEREKDTKYVAADLFHNRGVAQHRALYYEEAILSYQNCLILSPTHATCLSNLGLAYSKISLNNNAILCYQRALSLRPTDVTTAKRLVKIRNRLEYDDDSDIDKSCDRSRSRSNESNFRGRERSRSARRSRRIHSRSDSSKSSSESDDMTDLVVKGRKEKPNNPDTNNDLISPVKNDFQFY